MALKAQLRRIEGKVKSVPHLTATQWFQEHIQGGEDYEPNVAAAYLLAFNEIIEKPLPALWTKLQALFAHTNHGQWTIFQHYLMESYYFLTHEDERVEEGYDDDISKELSSCIALTYYWTFQDFPKRGDKRQRVLAKDDLFDNFIRPLLEHAHPPTKSWGNATIEEWLEAQPSDNDLAEDDDYCHFTALKSYIP